LFTKVWEDYTIPTFRKESFAITHRLTYVRSVLWLVAAILWLALTFPASAQAPGPPPINKVNAERQRQQEMSNREYQLRTVGENGRPLDIKDKKALMEQIEQDFNRILLLHNQIVRAITSEAPLDNRFVSDAATEIKKRSTRLQAILVLPPPKGEKEISDDSTRLSNEKLKPEMVTLCKHIKAFVTNPIIETPGTVNAEHLARARHDLASIVALSGLIRKHADQLRK
jgi:hypothetical protein